MTRPAVRRVLLLLLLLAGVALCLWCSRDSHGRIIPLAGVIRDAKKPVILSLAAIAIALIPRTPPALKTLFDRLRAPSDRQRLLIGIGLACIAGGYLLLTALFQHRELFPKWHDEFMYLVQARLILSGHLWLPALPLPDFFETFYVFTQPVYASQSFPGVSILWVPGLLLGWPHWVMPLIVASACIGLIYRIIAELLDGIYGLLAVLIVLGMRVFRYQALMAMANIPMLFWALMMILAWLKWRNDFSLRWAAMIGLASGWAALTRPADAVVVTGAVGVAMLLDLYKARSLPKAVRSISITVACALPFILLQLVFNHGVTGSWLKPPFNYYNERFQPQLALGVPRYDPNLKLQTTNQQKLIMYETWAKPYILGHQPENFIHTWLYGRIPIALEDLSPDTLLLILLPAGLLGLSCRPRWLLVSILPLFLILYCFYTIFMSQYCCLAIASATLLFLLGAKAVEEALPWRRFARVAMPGILAAVSISALPELSPGRKDDGHPSEIMGKFLTQLKQIKEPAVVLVKFYPENNLHEELVYCTDSAWPINAQIIRVHDLGEKRNREIFDYFALRQPNRTFYRFDRSQATLIRLGLAGELGRHP